MSMLSRFAPMVVLAIAVSGCSESESVRDGSNSTVQSHDAKPKGTTSSLTPTTRSARIDDRVRANARRNFEGSDVELSTKAEFEAEDIAIGIENLAADPAEPIARERLAEALARADAYRSHILAKAKAPAASLDD